jgi:hypothetical protein
VTICAPPLHKPCATPVEDFNRRTDPKAQAATRSTHVDRKLLACTLFWFARLWRRVALGLFAIEQEPLKAFHELITSSKVMPSLRHTFIVFPHLRVGRVFGLSFGASCPFEAISDMIAEPLQHVIVTLQWAEETYTRSR